MATQISSQVVTFLRSHKLLSHLLDWYTESKSGSITQGFIRGFILYYIPVTLLRRKLKVEVLHRSIAIGIFSASVRATNIFFTKEENKEKLENILKKTNFFQDEKIKEHIKRLVPAISGSIGILLASTVDNSLINSIFVLWCLMRALPFILPSIPYGSTLAMCLASTQIATAWVKRPEELNQSYRKFLISQGGKRASTLEIMKNSSLPASLVCQVNHPGQSCLEHGITYTTKSFFRGMRLYAPLQLLFFIMSSNRSVKKSLIGLLKSSLFMMFYCSSAWVLLCLNFKKPFVSEFSKFDSKALYLRLWISGLGVLIENPSRRRELAQYCCTYAADSLYRRGVVEGKVSPNLSIGKLILAFSWFLLMWNYESQPKVLSKWLLGLRDKIQGEKDKPSIQ